MLFFSSVIIFFRSLPVCDVCTRTTIYLLIFIIVFVSHFKNIFHFSNYAMWSHKMSCLLHFHSLTVGVFFLSNRCCCCCLRILFRAIMSFPSSNARTTAFLFISFSVSLRLLALGFAIFECCKKFQFLFANVHEMRPRRKTKRTRYMQFPAKNGNNQPVRMLRDILK